MTGKASVVRVVAEGVNRFDEAALPAVALPDTTVWLRAFDWEPDPGGTCKSFVEAMLHHGKQVLISAPTISELIRGDKTRKIPNRRGIVFVAFDPVAGQMLGELAPKEWLSEVPNGERTFIKFDCLIVACAKRWGASCVVSLDQRSTMRRAARAAGIDLFLPSRFLMPLEAALTRLDARPSPPP